MRKRSWIVELIAEHLKSIEERRFPQKVSFRLMKISIQSFKTANKLVGRFACLLTLEIQICILTLPRKPMMSIFPKTVNALP